MRRQKNMSQINDYNGSLEKELDKIETSNLSDAEFKILVIRKLNEVGEGKNF